MKMVFWITVLTPFFVWAYLSSRWEKHREGIISTASGRSKGELIGILGQPRSVSAMAGGRMLLQWQKKGSHISLMFRGDVCEGLTHRYEATGLKG